MTYWLVVCGSTCRHRWYNILYYLVLAARQLFERSWRNCFQNQQLRDDWRTCRRRRKSIRRGSKPQPLRERDVATDLRGRRRAWHLSSVWRTKADCWLYFCHRGYTVAGPTGPASSCFDEPLLNVNIVILLLVFFVFSLLRRIVFIV